MALVPVPSLSARVASVVLLAAAVSVAAMASACNGTVHVEPAPHVPRATSQPVAVPPTAPGVLPPEDVEVLYRDQWFGAVRLIGIDAQHRRALVRLELGARGKLAIDTIDLERGERLSRWEATTANAEEAMRRHPAFQPMTGTFEDDLVRFAELIHSTGPWYMRSAAQAPLVAISSDRQYILYGAPPTDGTDGDWLFVTDRFGRRPRRIDPGLKASYSPVFSPDGLFVAWQGCTSSPCDYGLFVTQLGGSPERVSGVSGSTPPVFSHDGEWLYTVGEERRRSCLYRVPVRAARRPERLRCVSDLSEVEFVQDPEGRTGVLSGLVGVPPNQVAQMRWVLLETGEVLASHAVPGVSGHGILNGSGMLAVSVQKGGMAVVDLITGHNGVVSGSAGWYFGFETTKWLGDELILLRKSVRDQFELVSVDGRRVTEAPPPTADSPEGVTI